jgi:hypothetical protein
VGFGIRLAQDVGVHRRKVHQHTPTAEDERIDEQWKRCFWYVVLYPILSDYQQRFVGCLYVWIDTLALLWADRVPFMTMSTFVLCMYACKSLTKIYLCSSFDLELPFDCDDEYWDHPDPKQRFKQPENKPSLISAFILFIKLNQILSYCLRTIVKSILHFTTASD